MRADFTADDLAQVVREEATGSGFVPVDKSSERFRLGAASASGWTNAPLLPPSDYGTGVLRISPPVNA